MLLSAALFGTGCQWIQDRAIEIRQVSIEEVAQLQSSGKVTLVDANTEEYRHQMGVLSKAVILTSAAKYEVEKELPGKRDAKLVFYCSSKL